MVAGFLIIVTRDACLILLGPTLNEDRARESERVRESEKEKERLLKVNSVSWDRQLQRPTPFPRRSGSLHSREKTPPPIFDFELGLSPVFPLKTWPQKTQERSK